MNEEEKFWIEQERIRREEELMRQIEEGGNYE